MKRKSQNIFKKRLIGKWRVFSIYVVDDTAVRNQGEHAEEFGNYGLNVGKKGFDTLYFDFIPKHEIWIARSIKISERHFIIENALSFIKNVEKGLKPEKAYDRAIKLEQLHRAKDAAKRFHIRKKRIPKNPPHGKIH